MKLSEHTPWHMACRISPTWITDDAWMVHRSLVDSPPAAILDSQEAAAHVLRPPHGIEVLADDEMFARVVNRAGQATVVHRVTEWVFRSFPEVVRLLPAGVIRRPIVEMFDLWGEELLSPAADGRSPLYLMRDGLPVVILMPCQPEPRWRFPMEPEPGP